MTISPLTAISPLEGRYAEKVAELRPIFSEFGLIKFRVLVEIQWLQLLIAQANLPELKSVSTNVYNLLEDIYAKFSESDAERVKEIEMVTNHDVKAVEYFIKEQLQTIPELAKIHEFIHFGVTSEDINNLAYALMLKNAREKIILPALENMLRIMKNLAHNFAELPLLSHTHGQPATPSTVGKEIANIIARLQRQKDQLTATPLLGKLNGASGNYNALIVAYPAVDWQHLSERLTLNLGLSWNPYTTQIEPHDYMAEMFAIMMRINTILIDFNRDMWGYISLGYFQQKSLSSEVGSSTMPHKINPIDFENSEGNLGIANALFAHFAEKLPISRWQRDLSDSTVLRNIGVAFAHSLLAYQSTCKGLGKSSPDSDVIKADLNQHWEVLGEAIQTLMRRYGIDEPYEKLKKFTRGKKIDKTLLQQFIAELALPDNVKTELMQLTPQTYIGLASVLAKRI
jgi:adenylosuccinate lyase